MILVSLHILGYNFPLNPKGIELDGFNLESKGVDCFGHIGFEDLHNGRRFSKQKHPVA